ncbi:MAG: DUF1566 domain-containing protein [Candidatus Thiodiazotropha sp. (ex. Lucinisca nassula)]|nr:DUF1566 domain-containing protein [Candidatus Thiodiazotropha sp. (ex. Lucinisca nassula)]
MKALIQSSKATIIFALWITLLAGCGGGGSSSEESAADTTVEGSSQQGYTLYARLDSTTTYLMDNDGNPVHSWASDYRPGNAIYLLEDGSLLHTGNLANSRFDAGGAGGIVQTIDWNGDVTWEYTYSSTTHLQHHDVEMLPNGNLLMIAWQYKSEAQALQAGRDPALLSEGALWPDSIIEVEPGGNNSGTIVWQWHIWDHLVQDYDASKSNYGVVADHPELIDLNFAINSSADWTHINSVDYNAELDQILLTVHNFSEVWVIDHSTTTAEAAGHSGGASGKGGDLLYRWGNPQAYDAGTAAEQMLFVPHDGEWIEAGYPGAGNIIIFNNGVGRLEGNYSSIDEITPPLEADNSYTLASGAAYGPSGLTWGYTAEIPTDFYARNISGQQRLSNGNTLICDGPSANFFEVTEAGETVWEYTDTGSVFRVERYLASYSGFDGTALDDEASNQVPTADAGGPYRGDLGTLIALDGSASSDADGTITSYAWDLDNDGFFDDASGNTAEFPANEIGSFTIGLLVTDDSGAAGSDTATVTVDTDSDSASVSGYPIVDTGQQIFFDNASEISTPASHETFYGQDAQFNGNQPSYTLSDDGLTVYDNVTGLTWTRSGDLDADDDIDSDDKLTFFEAQSYPDALNGINYGGYSDWRLPTMKELYSLMNFNGTDPMSDDTSQLTPFIDTDYFGFAYGDTAAGERVIDAQYWSDNAYVDYVFANQSAAFGLNLADGRIKGYPTTGPVIKSNFVLFVRGNTEYGANDFNDNGDATVTDRATNLMWAQDDSGSGMLWADALAWVQQKNSEVYLGYSDWRLPNAKEMQSILDYSRAPGVTASAAIDPIFNTTRITNEDGNEDYPWFWSGTTHIRQDGSGSSAVYLCFGRAMGYMNNSWLDVHGAGAQRSDQKDGDFSAYTYVTDGYYFGMSPQGDATRMHNYVRLVRDAL